jgi:hypothetical protein
VRIEQLESDLLLPAAACVSAADPEHFLASQRTVQVSHSDLPLPIAVRVSADGVGVGAAVVAAGVDFWLLMFMQNLVGFLRGFPTRCKARATRV